MIFLQLSELFLVPGQFCCQSVYSVPVNFMELNLCHSLVVSRVLSVSFLSLSRDIDAPGRVPKFGA